MGHSCCFFLIMQDISLKYMSISSFFIKKKKKTWFKNISWWGSTYNDFYKVLLNCFKSSVSDFYHIWVLFVSKGGSANTFMSLFLQHDLQQLKATTLPEHPLNFLPGLTCPFLNSHGPLLIFPSSPFLQKDSHYF